jgi:ribosome-associated translation inhibitor RaiA
MKVSILLKDLIVSSALRQQVEDRIRLVLSRFAPLIRDLTVTVNDENGPRGGIDTSCRLVLRLRGGTVVVNERANAVMTAVGQAADRAARAVARAHHRRMQSRSKVPRTD